MAVALVAYYFDFGAPPRWLEGLIALGPVLLGYAAARQVPFNVWRAYGRLRLDRTAIIPTLAFVLVAPFWAVFFGTYHTLLLDPLYGPVLLLSALLMFTGWNAWRERRAAGSSPSSTDSGSPPHA